MKKLLLFLIIPLMTALGAWGQATNPTPQTLPYTQNFNDLAHTSTTYPAGWQGWRLAADPGTAFVLTPATHDQALVASSHAGTTSGNVHNYNGKIGFLNIGSLDLSVALAINTTGLSSIVVNYDIMTLRNPHNAGTNTRINEVILQYRIGTTGNFINLNGTEYQNNIVAQTSGTEPQNLLLRTITLPADANNQPVVQLRLASRQVSGSGGRPSFAIDNVLITGTAMAIPLITAVPTSLSGFSYTVGAGPSTEQQFTASGSNLTHDITITAPANYEISLTSGSGFATSLILAQSGGSVPSTPVFARLRAGLAVGVYSENITLTSTGATDRTVTLNGNVSILLIPEPTNHATGFTATANSAGQITVTWIDASVGQLPSAYLVRAAVSPASPLAPIDGTPVADALLVKNIAQGVQQAIFTGLTPETTYNFSIWPYTNSGSNINFKTDGVIPTASAATTISATYTWSGAVEQAWTTAANWTPARNTPDANDILQFNHGAAVTVTAVPTQTIARLLVSNNTPVTLQAGTANNTVTIAGAAGTDLIVDAGSALNLTGANALSVTLGATATGSISGSMTLAGAGHRLNSGSANGITFNAGSNFTTGTDFAGNPFGTTPLNSVIFASGSTYNHNAGSNPFGATQPSSVVAFQTGSLYRQLSTVGLAFNGRIFANFELDIVGTISPDGGSAVRMDNLTVTRGTLNFNMTGTPGHAIRGNITVASGATLNFAPASAGTVNLSGTTLQTISGSGTITAGTNSSLIINNTAGVVLNNTASLHNVTISAGALTVNPNHNLTAAGTLTNNAGNSGLVLRSGASLVHSTDNVAATMERHFSGSRNWRLISSPVAGQAIAGAWTPSSPSHGYDFFGWDEPTQLWKNHKQANFNTWNTSGNFVPGRGYLVSFEGIDLTQSFVGMLNNTDEPVILTRQTTGAHRGANLLGNPYPSAIDWNSAVRTAFADNFAYIYNPTLGVGGGYETVNGAVAGALIAPNQGFFVLANAAGNFTFTNTMRRSGAVAFKSEPIVENMILRLSQGNFYNQTTLALVSESRWERDRNDALKFFSFNSAMPQLFSQSADQVQLAINSVPQVDQSSEFTLGLRAPNTGQYTLSLQTTSGFFDQRDVFVRDLITGAVHNLRQNPQFTFHATQGDHAARFKVSFTQPTTVGNLPQGTTAIYVHNNILHLNFASYESNRQLQVFDISGRVVKSQRLQDGASQSIPLSLEMGTYIVRITDSQGVATQRVMVK